MSSGRANTGVGQGNAQKQLPGEGDGRRYGAESPGILHLSTAQLYSGHGTSCIQWTRRALARDTETVNSCKWIPQHAHNDPTVGYGDRSPCGTRECNGAPG
jgi:hypothetical protein